MCVTPLQWERDSNRCKCLYYNRCEPYCRSALCLKLILIVHSLHTPYPNKQTHAHTHTHKQTNKRNNINITNSNNNNKKLSPPHPPPATRTQCIHTLASGNRDQRSGEQKWRPTFPSTQGDLIPNHFALTQSLTHTDTHTYTDTHTGMHARTQTLIDRLVGRLLYRVRECGSE